MKKLLLLLLTLLVAAVVLLVLNIGPLAKAAVERGGEHALGVPTHLAQAEIGLFSGSTKLTGLQVENPPGFQAENLIELNSVELDATVQSLLGDPVAVERFQLDGFGLFIERRGGQSNYGPILERLRAREKGEPVPEEEPAGDVGEGKRFRIGEIVVRDVSAALDIEVLGIARTASIELPEVRIQDLGDAQRGSTVPEIVESVLKAVLDAVVANGGGILPADLLDDLRGRLGQLKNVAATVSAGVEAKMDELKGEAAALTEGLEAGARAKAGELGEKAQQAKQDLEEQAKKAKEQLEGEGKEKAQEALKDLGEGLFGGKKKP